MMVLFRKYVFKKILMISTFFAVGFSSFSFGEVALPDNVSSVISDPMSVDRTDDGDLLAKGSDDDVLKNENCTKLADALNNPKNVSIKKFNSYRVRKDLYKDQLSLNNLEIKLNEAGFYIPRTIETTEIFRLNISKLAYYLPSEFKQHVENRFGPSFNKNFMLRDIYSISGDNKVGQLLHTRGKMFDGTFMAFAQIDVIDDKYTKIYFSDGKEVNIDDYTQDNVDKREKRSIKRWFCNNCSFYVSSICSLAGGIYNYKRNFTKKCVSRCLQFKIPIPYFKWACIGFCFVGGFTLCNASSSYACRDVC